MLKKLSIILLILLIYGCSSKNMVKKENQESAYIIFKTNKIKYADMGFIYRGDSFTKIEVYGMGQPLFVLNINGMNVCMSTFECMEKSKFNKKMLTQYYPNSILENILRGKPIFNGKNLKTNSGGFIQQIKKDGKYDIFYLVNGTNKLFKDKINKIKIEIKVNSATSS